MLFVLLEFFLSIVYVFFMCLYIYIPIKHPNTENFVSCGIVLFFALFLVVVSREQIWTTYKYDYFQARDSLNKIKSTIKFKVNAKKASHINQAPLYINHPDERIRMIAKETLERGTT